MKSYDISVDSDVNAGGDIFNRVYYMDFTKLPKGKYTVDWTFQSGYIAGLAGILATGPVCVHMDSWTGAYQYQAADSSCPTHSVFGALVPNMATATDGYMGCDLKQNGSITIDTLPFSSFFTIKLRFGMGTTPPASFSRYFMTMELTPLE